MTNRLTRWIAGALVTLPLSGMAALADEPMMVGFIYPSPVAEVGWAKQLDLAREAVEETYGDRVTTRVVENIAVGPDAARVMNQLVADGAGLVVLGSFGYMNDGLRLAASKPDVAFLHASGFRQTENLGTFTARNYEGSYLTGTAGAMISKTNTLGIVAAFAVPEVIAEVNAITLAARRENPDVNIRTIWLNTWFDPAREQEAARALVSQGADVIYSLHQDTPSVVNVAQAEGVYVVNTGSDMRAQGPDAVLAGVVMNWAPYIVKEVGAKLDGTFKGYDERGGLASGTVSVEGWSKDLTDEQMEKLTAIEAALKSGELHVFAGPLKDQAGTERVAEGEVLPDPEIFSMNWLVEGLDGALPQ